MKKLPCKTTFYMTVDVFIPFYNLHRAACILYTVNMTVMKYLHLTKEDAW